MSKFKAEVKAGIHRGTLTFPADAVPLVPSKTEKNFQDDFTKESDRWLESSGTWKAEAGTYKQTNSALRAVTGIKDPSWSDATFTFSIHFDGTGDGANWAVFQFRKPDASSSHEQGGYMVYLRRNGTLEFFNGRMLQSAKTGLDTSKQIRFKVVAQGDHFQVYLNNEAKARIDVRDSAFSDGTLGFSSLNTSVSFGSL